LSPRDIAAREKENISGNKTRIGASQPMLTFPGVKTWRETPPKIYALVTTLYSDLYRAIVS
jgi:hypothetical protein